MTSIKPCSFQQWFSSPRFAHTSRLYSASSLLPVRSQFNIRLPSHILSTKLYGLLRKHQRNGTASTTFGCMDPVQVVQMAPYVDTIYVSGWQCASTAPSNDQFGPDFADYPYCTVPNKVQQLFKAQQFHDEKQRLLQYQKKITTTVDYSRPIIADADSGFGGTTTIMKLTKMMIEAGASGIHLEDQRSGAKKCGHLGSKVLVPIQEHIDRLMASRLQADLLQCPLVLIARTDAESAKYLDSNIDERDHPFIKGILKSEAGEEICTFPNAIKKLCQYEGRSYHPHLYQGSFKDIYSQVRQSLKSSFSYSWEPLRTREGFYQVEGSIQYAIARCLAFAPYADVLWVETSKPDYHQAQIIATSIRRQYQHQMLSYNLSPSFNWDSNNMTNDDIYSFSNKLAQLGFCFQFITLAGFHINGLATTNFSRHFQHKKMLAYVDEIQRPEREQKLALVKHQMWSGVDVADYYQDLLSDGSSSIKANSNGSIEYTFT